MNPHAAPPTTPALPTLEAASHRVRVSRLETLGVRLALEVIGLREATERGDLDLIERGEGVFALAREILSEDIPWTLEREVGP